MAENQEENKTLITPEQQDKLKILEMQETIDSLMKLIETKDFLGNQAKFNATMFKGLTILLENDKTRGQDLADIKVMLLKQTKPEVSQDGKS